ncbi:hypothetical protein PPTG_06180 [Phytophthora nicotianae INRA-310]|uniref:Uncharacterized protein n=2 Tax=Phytophthora nicotianae TaxID=4792 RepID=W2QUH2_PHYN3|nr:hypothetical protein PPTG_06180 [Phytophthora nicotianae INRA-310]ETM31908.1 hypothetical protein L914_20594 [Phytophthora nicotianae]ETN15915.1 hypothetical protein PPTG_06180 [Phytophthora nicotianae INRA-310]
MSEGNEAREAVATITRGGTQSLSEGSTVCVAGPHLPSPQHPDESPSRAPLLARTPTRVSPYPLRLRTPPQALTPPLHPHSRTSPPQGPSVSRRVTASQLESDQFQLVVKRHCQKLTWTT